MSIYISIIDFSFGRQCITGYYQDMHCHIRQRITIKCKNRQNCMHAVIGCDIIHCSYCHPLSRYKALLIQYMAQHLHVNLSSLKTQCQLYTVYYNRNRYLTHHNLLISIFEFFFTTVKTIEFSTLIIFSNAFPALPGIRIFSKVQQLNLIVASYLTKMKNLKLLCN